MSTTAKLKTSHLSCPKMVTAISSLTDPDIKKLIEQGLQKFHAGETPFSFAYQSVLFEIFSQTFGFPILNPTEKEWARITYLMEECQVW